MSLDHAVAAVDFSPVADTLIACLPELIPLGLRRVTLVYVLDVHYPHAPEIEHLTHYRQRLRQAADGLRAEGLDVQAEVRIGDPATEIVEAVREYGASLIVLGSHGHGRVKETLLGSVADVVTKRAFVPVLLLPVKGGGGRDERYHRPHDMKIAGHILYATDFSDMAEAAFVTVRQLACNAQRITLLHVQQSEADERQDEIVVQADRARLNDLERRLTDAGASRVETRLARGAPGEIIVRIAYETEATLIIAGSQGKGFVREFLLGSVSHYLVRHAAMPVMLIPYPSSEEER